MVTNIKDIDAVDKLLFLGIVFFTFVLLAIARFQPNDGQTFQIIGGLLTGFSGAFFARMKPKADTPTPPTAGDTKPATDITS